MACLTTDVYHPISQSTFSTHLTFHGRPRLDHRHCLKPPKSPYKPLGLLFASTLIIGKTTPSRTNVLNKSRTQMALTTVTGVQVEIATFPPAATPPGSDKTLFLGGAGARGLEIQGKFVKFTTIGVYLEDNAVKWLAGKWKGKSAEELTESVGFFRDIVTGPFEKFTRVTMILPLTGPQYSEKVSENCVAIWKALGIYTDAEEKAIEKFIEVFKDQNFPPGSSILFTQSPTGSLKPPTPQIRRRGSAKRPNLSLSRPHPLSLSSLFLSAASQSTATATDSSYSTAAPLFSTLSQLSSPLRQSWSVEWTTGRSQSTATATATATGRSQSTASYLLLSSPPCLSQLSSPLRQSSLSSCRLI